MNETIPTKAQVRLEILKLTCNAVHPTAQIIEKSKELEQYVLGEEKKVEILNPVANKTQGNQKQNNKKDDKLPEELR